MLEIDTVQNILDITEKVLNKKYANKTSNKTSTPIFLLRKHPRIVVIIPPKKRINPTIPLSERISKYRL